MTAPMGDSGRQGSTEPASQQRPTQSGQSYSLPWRLLIVGAGVAVAALYQMVHLHWGPYGMWLAAVLAMLVTALIAWAVRGQKP